MNDLKLQLAACEVALGNERRGVAQRDDKIKTLEFDLNAAKQENEALANLLWEHPSAPCDQESVFESMASVKRLREQNKNLLTQQAHEESIRAEMKTEVHQLRAEVERLKETHIMQLAAISVAANSNTEATLEQALKCHPDYKTVALSVVLVAIQREIWERNQKDQWRAVAEQAGKAFHNYPNVPSHQKCLDWLAAYEKQKAGK